MPFVLTLNGAPLAGWCVRSLRLTSPPSGSRAVLTNESHGTATPTLNGLVRISLNGVDLFAGWMRELSHASQGAELTWTAVIRGAWYDWELTQATQVTRKTTWNQQLGQAQYTTFLSSDVYPGVRTTSGGSSVTQISCREQLLDWGAVNVPSLGSGDIVPPVQKFSGITKASAALGLVEWQLELMLAENAATGAVTARNGTMAGAAVREFAYGTVACEVALAARTDVVGVVINHKRIHGPIPNGATPGGWEVFTETAGTGAAGQAKVIVYDFDYTQPVQNNGVGQAFTVSTRPIPSGSSGQTSLRNWWKHHAPHLAWLVDNTPLDWQDFEFEGHQVARWETIDGTFGGGALGGSNPLNNELVAGVLPEWAGATVPARVYATVKCNASLPEEARGIFGGGAKVPLLAEINTVNSGSTTYRILSGGGVVSNWNPVPGLAAKLYDSLQGQEYEGTIGGPVGAVFPGERVNVTEGNAAWATMKALVHEVAWNEHGEWKARLGPGRKDSLARMQALAKKVRDVPSMSFNFARERLEQAGNMTGQATIESKINDGRPIKNNLQIGGGGSAVVHPFQLTAGTKSVSGGAAQDGVRIQYGMCRASGVDKIPTIGNGTDALVADLSENFLQITGVVGGSSTNGSASIFLEFVIVEDDFGVTITTVKVKFVVGATLPVDTPTMRHLRIGSYAKSSTGAVTVASLIQWNLQLERCGAPAVQGATSWEEIKFNPL